MATEQAARRSLMEAREQAEKILAQAHTGEDAKIAIRAFLQVGLNFESFFETWSGQNADVRVMRKKFEASRQENKELVEKLAAAKKKLLSMATEIEMINVETSQILKRPEAAAIKDGLDRISGCAVRLVEVVMELMSGT